MCVGFVGAGTVGTALAVTLSRQGYVVAAVASRTFASAERLARTVNEVSPATCAALKRPQQVADLCDLVFITTPDDAIVEVARQIRWRPGQFVVHCSGALSNEALREVAARGAVVGGFHPLQSFANVDEALQNLPGSTFGLEADGPLLGILERMAERLGGHWVRLEPQDKVLYHAAAVMASNYTVALMKMATDLWLRFGVSRPEATEALLPLLRGTVNNIARIGLPGCLTGPIARGDYGTVEKHLQALEVNAPQLLAAYCEVGLQALEVAMAKGKVTHKQAERLRLVLGSRSDRKVARRHGGNGGGGNGRRRHLVRKERECVLQSLA